MQLKEAARPRVRSGPLFGHLNLKSKNHLKKLLLFLLIDGFRIGQSTI
jgi:hypothetical protein